jgi:ATP-binding cassette subfamily C protein LapB
MTATDIWSRGLKLASMFGIGRQELEALGLDKTHLLRMPRSVIAASIAINLLALALPLTILQVYDRVIPHQSVETLAILLLGLVAVVAIDTILRIARAYVTAWAATRFTQAAVVAAFDRVIFAPRRAVEKDPSARQLQRIQAVQRLGEFYGGKSRLVLLDLPFVAIFIGILAIIASPLAIVALALLVIFTAVTMHMGRMLKLAIEQRDFQDAKIYDFIADVLTGITTLKGLAMEPMMLRRFERLQRRAAEMDFRAIETGIRSEAKVTSLGNVTLVAMVTFGGALAVFDHMTIGLLSACTLLSSRVIQPILGAASLWNEVQKMRLGLDQVKVLLELPEPDRTAALAAVESPPAIILSAVGFAEAQRTVIEPIDIRLAAGTMVAFTGQDAGCRAALIALMAGEIGPTSGSISIGGIDPAQFRHSRPGAICVVPRSPTFFKGTILDNLTLFGRGPSAQEACGAVALVGLDRDIDRLPRGYATELGEGVAETLPLGLLKRLALARGLAVRPDLLILDEPQAFLDAEADRQQIASLGRIRGLATIVIMTTRPSYVAIAERAFECRDRQVVEIRARTVVAETGAPAARSAGLAEQAAT